MLNAIRTAAKKLFSDKRGEDLTEKSSALSNAAKTCIALGCAAATAAGAAAVSNSSNNASNTASDKVLAPVGAQAAHADNQSAVYK